jgi:hypothetical protein
MGTGYLPAHAEEWRRWGLRGLLFLALVVITWPVAGVTPYPGLDQAWVLGLNLGVADGLAWGRDLVFTYGPLGYSVFPLAIDRETLLAALIVAGFVQLLLVAVLYLCLRRRYGPLASTILTFLGACTIGAAQYDATIAIAFGLVVLALTAPEQRVRQATWALAVGGPALAALGLLIKLNAGVGAAAVVAIGLCALPSPKRALPLALASGLLSLVVLWLVAGQPLPALGDYLRNSLDTVGGYVEAMGYEEGGSASEWHLLVILGSAVALTGLVWASFPELSDRRRAALAAAVLAMHYFVLREVFLRHNLARGATFAVLIVVVLMIPWPWPRRGLSMAIAAALTIAFIASVGTSIDSVWGPRTNAHALAHELHVVVDDEEFEHEQEFGRAAIKAEDLIPPSVLAPLRGRCLTAEPIEVAAVWAYGFDWCPLPTLQTYGAFTSRLDQLDADRYADPESGPDGVIRQDFAIDERLPAWESPAAMLAMLCNFESAADDGRWQALVRVEDRCDEPRKVGTVEGELGQPIELPPAPPGTVLTARVHGLEIGGFERLEMLFTRPAMRWISINGEPRHRVVPGTVGDGLILDVPRRADYPEPFELGQHAKTLTAEINGQEGGSISVDLEAVPIDVRAGRAKP